MLKVAGREDKGRLTDEGYLRVKDIKTFPCTVLRTIDTLWEKYSKGRFGFSVQKRIWESIGGTRDADYETYNRFAMSVGWRVKYHWLDYHSITFSVKAPEGHLPVGIWFGRAWGWEELGVDLSSFASRLVDCNI
jgi:hypothetical protein